MSKRIWERFPEYVKRCRIKRGEEASGKILSYPTEDEFFQGLFDFLIFYEKTTFSNKIEKVVAVCKDENNRYGLLIYSWCSCDFCPNPITDCTSGKKLQKYVDYILEDVIWFDNVQTLVERMPALIEDKNQIKNISEAIAITQ